MIDFLSTFNACDTTCAIERTSLVDDESWLVDSVVTYSVVHTHCGPVNQVCKHHELLKTSPGHLH
jgi:hypothetical protein